MNAILWSDIENNWDSFTEVTDGFSGADRRIGAISSGEKIFVKRATSEATKTRLQKEIAVYRILEGHKFASSARLLAVAGDKTGLALEALVEEDGWEWSTVWTRERLAMTLEAMDALATLELTREEKDFFTVDAIDEVDEAWVEDYIEKGFIDALHQRIRKQGHMDTVADIDFAALAARARVYTFHNVDLVHNDVRRDNCAWNPQLGKVRLIDWDWAQIGDRRVDVNSMLVNAYKGGIDVVHEFRSRVDTDALAWLANYWFKSAATPIWNGGNDELRDFQLDSAVSAYEMLGRCTDSKS